MTDVVVGNLAQQHFPKERIEVLQIRALNDDAAGRQVSDLDFQPRLGSSTEELSSGGLRNPVERTFQFSATCPSASLATVLLSLLEDHESLGPNRNLRGPCTVYGEETGCDGESYWVTRCDS